MNGIEYLQILPAAFAGYEIVLMIDAGIQFIKQYRNQV